MNENLTSNLLNKMNIINNSVSSMKDHLNLTQATNLETLTQEVRLPRLEAINVTLSANNDQTLTPSENYDGLSPVNVPRVTASIDSYIKPENIKKNVEILGITGNYGFTSEVKRVSASPNNDVNVLPSPGVNFLEKVIINQVTSGIDTNISEANIKTGVSILGVTGNYAGDEVVQPNKNVYMETNTMNIYPDQGFTVMRNVKVTLNKSSFVTDMDIDARTYNSLNVYPISGYIGINSLTIYNLLPNIIKSGVTLFGVSGTYVGDPEMLQEKTVTPRTYPQNILPDENYFALSKVTVGEVNSSLEPNLIPNNIRLGTSVFGVVGSVIERVAQSKSVNPQTTPIVVNPDTSNGYNCLSSVTVNAVNSSIDNSITSENIKYGVNILGVEGNYTGGLTLQNKTVTPLQTQQTITPDDGYQGLNEVVVNAVNTETIDIIPSKNPQNFIPNSGNFYNYIHVRAVDSECDPNIQPENIKKNMSILGVVGTFEGDTSGYFGSLSGGTSVTCGSWVNCILSLPNTLALSGTSAASLFAGFPGDKIPTIDTSEVTTFNFAFQSCTNITSINTLDTSKMVYGLGMFSGCTNLSSIPHINFYNLSNLYLVLNSCNNLKYDITGEYNSNMFWKAFYNCTNIYGDVTLNTNVTGLWINANGAFYNCYNLNSIVFTGTLRTLNSMPMSFYNTNLFGNIAIGSSGSGEMNRSFESTFENCKKLESYNGDPLSNYLINVGTTTNMFRNCINLATVNGLNISYIKYKRTDLVRELVLTKDMFSDCTNLISVTNMTLDANTQFNNTNQDLYICNMFRNCFNLTTVNIVLKTNTNQTMTSHVRFLGLFENCSSLNYIPEFALNLQNLESTFTNMTGLTSIENITFNPSLSTINNQVLILNNSFSGCSNLKYVSNITCNGRTLCLSHNAFANCTNLEFCNFALNPITTDMGGGTAGTWYTNHQFYGCDNLKALIFNDIKMRVSYSLGRFTPEHANMDLIAFKGANSINIANSYVSSFFISNYNYMYFYNSVNVYSSAVRNMCRGNLHSYNEIRTMNIVSQPDKTSYTSGESFDPTGMVINVQNLLDVDYDYDNHSIIETLGEEYTLSTYSIDKTTLTTDDTSVNVYVQNPLNNISVEIPITVTE